MYSNIHRIYSQKHLIIPDYVIPSDIQVIYDYFEKYQIAKLENVKYHEDNKLMYEDPTTGEFLHYGYATIKVDEWYDNNGTRSFYESLQNNKCRMVFNDPDYWELYFDDEVIDIHDETNRQENHNELESYSKEDGYSEDEKCDYVEIKLEGNNQVVPHPHVEESREEEEKEEQEEEKEKDEFSYVSDSDYEYDEEAEHNSEDDEYEYEYEYKYYKKIDGPQTRSKTKAMTNPGNDKSVSELIIKNNKNYRKNNKTKEFKNVWSRRLRRKLSA